MEKGYRKVERMTATMRTIHWVNFFSMIVAIITGFYIAEPYYQTLIADSAVDKYVMGWNRWWHFMVAIIFDVTSIVVVYLYFFSRFEKPYKKILPTRENIREFWEVLVNLLTLNRVKRFNSSHADSFNTVYFTIFHLLLAWMLLTGLQLYVHGLASGESSIGAWWPWMLHLATDWTVPVSGLINGTASGVASLMDVRITHHYAMWFIIVWVLFHIYYQVWRTIYWQEGDIGIAFSGEKFAK